MKRVLLSLLIINVLTLPITFIKGTAEAQTESSTNMSLQNVEPKSDEVHLRPVNGNITAPTENLSLSLKISGKKEKDEDALSVDSASTSDISDQDTKQPKKDLTKPEQENSTVGHTTNHSISVASPVSHSTTREPRASIFDLQESDSDEEDRSSTKSSTGPDSADDLSPLTATADDDNPTETGFSTSQEDDQRLVHGTTNQEAQEEKH